MWVVGDGSAWVEVVLGDADSFRGSGSRFSVLALGRFSAFKVHVSVSSFCAQCMCRLGEGMYVCK